MGTLHFKVVRYRHTDLPPGQRIYRRNYLAAMATTLKKYSAVDLLKLSPGVNPAASAKVTLPAEFLNLCEVIMPGAVKAYNKNQEPSDTLEETTGKLYVEWEQRLSKKHKNYLRRQRAKQAKALKKQQAEDTESVSSGSEKSAPPAKKKIVRESEKIVEKTEMKTESVASRSNSPHKRDEVKIVITPSKIMPTSAAKNGSSSPRVYTNSRLRKSNQIVEGNTGFRRAASVP